MTEQKLEEKMTLEEESLRMLEGKSDSDILEIPVGEMRIFIKEIVSIMEDDSRALNEAQAEVDRLEIELKLANESIDRLMSLSVDKFEQALFEQALQEKG